MNAVLRKKLLVVAMATAFVGVSSVAAAEEEPEEELERQVEEAVEQADEEAGQEVDESEQADEESDDAEEDEQPIDELEDEQPADELEDADEQEPWDEPEPQADEEVIDEDEEEQQEQEEDEEDADEDEEEDEEPFAPTFGFGVDTGFFFSDLERFNEYILEPNDHGTLDVLGTQHIDLVVESEVLENLRISMLGGATFSWQRDPSAFGWYVGLEPAYAVGDDEWGMALGVSGAIGGLRLGADDEEVRMSLAMLRPFVEGRRYFSENVAAHLRVGFNHWWPGNPRSEQMDLDTAPGATELGTVQLQTGGLFIAAGARFGALQGLGEPEEELEATQQQDDEIEVTQQDDEEN